MRRLTTRPETEECLARRITHLCGERRPVPISRQAGCPQCFPAHLFLDGRDVPL
jgi:hypothetical protein